MKIKFKQLLGIFAMLCVAFLMSCEGPEGPAGADGTNGVDGVDGQDGNVTCLECHSESTIIEINAQFVQSQHKLGEFVGYAGGRGSCAQCHSSDGFIEYAEFGSVEGSTLNAPGAWECKTCHGIHSTFEADDYALRASGAVAWIFDDAQTIDFGDNSNVCANCHQSRRAEPNVTDPGTEFDITSTHYGPHHGAQANVLAGVGFAEIAGSTTYPAAGSSTHMNAGATCVTCHMSAYGDGLGGHTWNPGMSACNACHSGTDLTEDYDYKDYQTEMEELLVELRDLLVAQHVVEYDSVGMAYHPVVGTHDMVQAQAFFNWIGLEEDRSLGVHNPEYTKALLENSIEALSAK